MICQCFKLVKDLWRLMHKITHWIWYRLSLEWIQKSVFKKYLKINWISCIFYKVTRTLYVVGKGEGSVGWEPWPRGACLWELGEERVESRISKMVVSGWNVHMVLQHYIIMITSFKTETRDQGINRREQLRKGKAPGVQDTRRSIYTSLSTFM